MEFLRKHEFAVWLGLTLLAVGSIGAAFMIGGKGPLIFIVPAIIAIVVLGLRDQLSGHVLQQARRESLMEVAERLGFEFYETGPFNVLGWPASFELTRRAAATTSAIDPTSMLGRFVAAALPKSRNLMRRSWVDRQLTLFDFEFCDNDITYNKWVVAIQSPQLQRPYFRLESANIWNHLFKSDAVHGRHRVAKGSVCPDNVEAITSTLGRDQILEVGDGFLLLYARPHRPLAAGAVELRIQEGLQLHDVIAAARHEQALA
jgi:hypothetical protein